MLRYNSDTTQLFPNGKALEGGMGERKGCRAVGKLHKLTRSKE